MDCRHCRDELASWHDQELDVGRTAVVDAHLAGCESCRSEAAHLKSVSALFRPLRGESPPARLWPAIEELVRASRTRREHRFRRRWMPRVAAACVGAVLVLSGALFLEPRSTPTPDQTAHVHQAAPSPEADGLGGLLGSMRGGVTSEAEFLKETQAVGRRAENRLLAAVLAAGR